MFLFNSFVLIFLFHPIGTLTRFVGKQCSCAHTRALKSKKKKKKENSTSMCIEVISLLLFNCSRFRTGQIFFYPFCLLLKMCCSMFIFTNELYTYEHDGREDRLNIDSFKSLLSTSIASTPDLLSFLIAYKSQ